MNWIYKNNSKHVIIYNNKTCRPNEEITSAYPLPASLVLTCIQEGSTPDPVILHDDISLNAGEQTTININAPERSPNIAISILCMTSEAGVECRFNHENNNPVPIDGRSFNQTLPWVMCSRIILSNPTANTAIISITAVEVVS